MNLNVKKVELNAAIAADEGVKIVQPSCSKNDGQWHCVTHSEAFRNQFEKDTHIHDGREHVMAWWCFACGQYEVP